jgi:hypothetical protein
MSQPAHLRAFVLARIDCFARERPATQAWLDSDVARLNALPIYIDWTAVLAITPDGSLFEWSTEHPNPNLIEPEPRWARLALAQGLKRYPELLPLRPSRPVDGVDCQACGGSGVLQLPPGISDNVVCRCGGLGWLLPGEF